MAMKLGIRNVDDLLKRYSFPQRMRDELAVLFKANMSKVLSRTRVSRKGASFKTQAHRLYTICRTIEEIRELGFKVESPYSLSGKHFDAVVKRWVDERKEVGTMQGKLSQLKAFTHWMGKFDLVRSLYDYVPKERLAEMGLIRKYVATTDKSWEAHGVDPVTKIAEIAKTNVHVAIQLKLQAAFGLRIEESFTMPIAITIRKLLKSGNGKIEVIKGTKGGRPREVPVQLQLAVLEEALQYVNPRTGSTTPGHLTTEKWRDRYNKVMRKHGLYKKGLGVTSHGLRHEWLQALYKTLTGNDAPIKGGDERPAIEEHKAAMREVIEAAGHSMPNKSGMYLSSWTAMDQLKAPVVTFEDVHRAIGETGGNKKEAAARLGIARTKLYRILERGVQNG